MLTRDTHARIYQGELSKQRYEKLQSTAGSSRLPVREVVLSAVKDYLDEWQGAASVEIEEVVLSNSQIRFFLWLPYAYCSELRRLMTMRGKDVQDLVREAIKKAVKIDIERPGLEK